MNTYTLTIHAEDVDTGYLRATIMRGNVPVAEVSNSGDGGCHRYLFTNASEEEAFKATATAAVPEGTYEPEDRLVCRLATNTYFTDQSNGYSIVIVGGAPAVERLYGGDPNVEMFRIPEASGLRPEGASPYRFDVATQEFQPV